MCDHWMQILSSEYLQYELVKKVLLDNVEEKGKIVDDDGNLNHALIKKVNFEVLCVDFLIISCKILTIYLSLQSI